MSVIEKYPEHAKIPKESEIVMSFCNFLEEMGCLESQDARKAYYAYYDADEQILEKERIQMMQELQNPR